MIQAARSDKPLVLEILTDSFNRTNILDHIVKQDDRRKDRICGLMEYAFNHCFEHGNVWFNNDYTACALVQFHDKKSISFKALQWEIKLALNVIGTKRFPHYVKQKAKIRQFHPKDPFLHLWYIGVNPSMHNQGLDTELIRQIEIENNRKRDIYFDTSIKQNIPYLEKLGYEVFNTMDFSYKLYQLRKVF